MTSRKGAKSISAIGALDAAERALVLDQLLAAHPELHDEAETLAAEYLKEASREGVTEDLAWDLESIPTEDVYERAGAQSIGGYVEPTEAAWELIEQAVEPYIADMRRHAELGMAGAAGEVAVGILAGLYRCKDAAEGTALEWAPAADVTFELAKRTVAESAKVGVVPTDADLAEACPDWAHHGLGPR